MLRSLRIHTYTLICIHTHMQIHTRSDDAKNWARRARVCDIERKVEETTDMRRDCHCICEWVRVFNIFKEATIRTATVRFDWKPNRPTELDLKEGDILTVVGKDEEESANDPNITWYRGILHATEPVSSTANATRASPNQSPVRAVGARGTPKGHSKSEGGSSRNLMRLNSPAKPPSNPVAEPDKTVLREGLFPTLQLLCTERGKPMYDDVR
jgi:hypothetical protein